MKEKMICPCCRVTVKDLKNAVKNGADSFKAVKKETKVGCRCGKCRKKAKKTVKKLLLK